MTKPWPGAILALPYRLLTDRVCVNDGQQTPYNPYMIPVEGVLPMACFKFATWCSVSRTSLPHTGQYFDSLFTQARRADTDRPAAGSGKGAVRVFC